MNVACVFASVQCACGVYIQCTCTYIFIYIHTCRRIIIDTALKCLNWISFNWFDEFDQWILIFPFQLLNCPIQCDVDYKLIEFKQDTWQRLAQTNDTIIWFESKFTCCCWLSLERRKKSPKNETFWLANKIEFSVLYHFGRNTWTRKCHQCQLN